MQQTIHTRPNLKPEDQVRISIRPERIRVGGADGAANGFDAIVHDVIYHGDHLQLLLRSGAETIRVKSDRFGSVPVAGEALSLAFSPADCWVVGR